MLAKSIPGPLALVAATFLSASVVLAQARTFRVRDDGGSRIHFTSDAPLETISGVSSSVTGELAIDPTNLSSASGAIEVPVASLRTGIDLRDEHLRSDSWLDAARYPTARFELLSVSGATALVPGQDANVQIRGRFTIHGRTREVVARARAQWMADATGQGTNTIRVRAHFDVQLSDYGVSIPSIVQLKVSNTIGIDVSLRATAG